MSQPTLSPTAQRQIEESFRNDKEAHRLLELVNAEFQSDPMSVQCFDLRIVEEVRQCVELRKMLVRNNPMIG